MPGSQTKRELLGSWLCSALILWPAIPLVNRRKLRVTFRGQPKTAPQEIPQLRWVFLESRSPQKPDVRRNASRSIFSYQINSASFFANEKENA
jgi:hypothetical protein